MTAKEYLENEAKIWGKVDDDNITKSVIIQIAEGYAKHLIDKYNTDICEFAEWCSKNGWVYIDFHKYLVGKEGVITGFSDGRYSVYAGTPMSWFDEEQLELINN